MIKGCDNLIRFANEQDAAEIAKLHVNSIRSTYKNREYSNIKLDLVNRKVKLPKLGLVDIRGCRNQKNNTEEL